MKNNEHLINMSVDARGWRATVLTQETSSTVLQVQQAGLTNVFHLTAGLTHFRLLKAHPDARTPAEHGEGTRTDLGQNRKQNNCLLNTLQQLNVEEGKENEATRCTLLSYLALLAILFFGLVKIKKRSSQ